MESRCSWLRAVHFRTQTAYCVWFYLSILLKIQPSILYLFRDNLILAFKKRMDASQEQQNHTLDPSFPDQNIFTSNTVIKNVVAFFIPKRCLPPPKITITLWVMVILGWRRHLMAAKNEMQQRGWHQTISAPYHVARSKFWHPWKNMWTSKATCSQGWNHKPFCLRSSS